MLTRPVPRLLAPAAALLLVFSVALLSGCGDDDSSSAATGPTPSQTASAEEQTYYQALADALAPFAAEGRELNDFRAQAFDPAKTEEERLDGAGQFGERYEDFMTRRRDAIAALTPPESINARHQSLVESAGDMVTLAQTLNTRLADQPVATDADFAGLFFDADGASVSQRYRDACTSMQAHATQTSVALDFGCNES